MKEQATENEDLRRAVKWVSGNIRENPDQPVPPLVQEVILRFDISPKDAEFLIGLFHERKEENNPFP